MVKRPKSTKVTVVRAPVGPRKPGEAWRKYTDTSGKSVVRQDSFQKSTKVKQCLVSRIYSWGSF